MDEALARDIAHHSHKGQTTRHGAPMADHVERVAAAVPDTVRVVALLHDVLEKSHVRREDLRRRGLTPTELAALDLLTRRDDETLLLHTVRIAEADGSAGTIARSVKLADLDDHLSQPGGVTDKAAYRRARRLTVAAQLARRETPAVPRPLSGGARAA